MPYQGSVAPITDQEEVQTMQFFPEEVVLMEAMAAFAQEHDLDSLRAFKVAPSGHKRSYLVKKETE